ncbi:DUF4828 domain-containing protein [Lacticaseibacillus baoqingensis]|uniref:DUF4828 domain-containing protein n=1 Tax=Lacticaseibacillus baoqingensis TaxID=2486013 RepID=A0ABW4E3H7_9LACO|nr:DUF4828 domain-containing protein [Lacticaseibacillus baoqingensis]
MATRFHDFMRVLTQMVEHHPRQPQHDPVLDLAQTYTGQYGFLDEQTNKSHQLSISPELTIKIDGRTLPGQVTGITTEKLTFLDHYGYQLIVTCGPNGPESVYDEAEDAIYRILTPETDQPLSTSDE